MAPPSQVPVPKQSTKSYYAPDDETSYSSSRHSVTYSKKSTYPVPSSGARESSRPVNKESVGRASATATTNPDVRSHEVRKRPRSPSPSAAHKNPRREPSPLRRRRSPSRSRRSPSRSRRSPLREHRSPSRSHYYGSRRSPSRGRRPRSRSSSRDNHPPGRARSVDNEDDANKGGGEEEMEYEVAKEIREQGVNEETGEKEPYNLARAGPSNHGANFGPTRHDDSDSEAEVKDKGKEKAVRAYDDDIDEMRGELDQSWRRIIKLEEGLGALKSLRGDVATLKQQITGLERIRDDVQTLRGTVASFVALVGSNASPAELQSFANKASATLEGVSDPTAMAAVPALANQSSKPKRSHKKKVNEDVVMYDAAKERILVDHSRRTIYRLLGITVARQLRPAVQNKDKTYQFWVKDENNVKVMNPVWGPQLGVNKSAKNGWVPAFIEACQDENHMLQNKAFLLSVPGSKFASVLESTTWPGLWDKWREIEKGTVDEKEEKGRVRGRDYNRANLKAKVRDQARPGTEVAGIAMDFLANRDLQSPEISDSENSNRKCIDQALWRSKKLIDTVDALSLKGKLSKKKPSPASRTVVVYYKTNTPIPVLLGGLRIPLWAVCPTWIKNNGESFRASKSVIDMTASDPPDVSTLLNNFPPPARNYVNKRPIRAKAETLHAVESPPHSELPLPSDDPSFVPRENESEPPEAQAPPLIIPGPLEMINEPRVLDPNIEPSLQGKAGTIVIPQHLHPLQQLPQHIPLPPINPALPPLVQPIAQATSDVPAQQVTSQSGIPGLQHAIDSAWTFLNQQNNPSAPNAHLGQPEHNHQQDEPQTPPQVYRSPPMPPPASAATIRSGYSSSRQLRFAW